MSRNGGVADYLFKIAGIFIKRNVLFVFCFGTRGIICTEEDDKEADVGCRWRGDDVREDFQGLTGGVAAESTVDDIQPTYVLVLQAG